MVYAATCAPSPANSQAWEFVVVKERATKQKLADLSGGRPNRSVPSGGARSPRSCMGKGSGTGPRVELGQCSRRPVVGVLFGLPRGVGVDGRRRQLLDLAPGQEEERCGQRPPGVEGQLDPELF